MYETSRPVQHGSLCECLCKPNSLYRPVKILYPELQYYYAAVTRCDPTPSKCIKKCDSGYMVLMYLGSELLPFSYNFPFSVEKECV